MYWFRMRIQSGEYLGLMTLTKFAAAQIFLYLCLSSVRHFKSWLGQGTAISRVTSGYVESRRLITISAFEVRAHVVLADVSRHGSADEPGGRVLLPQVSARKLRERRKVRRIKKNPNEKKPAKRNALPAGNNLLFDHFRDGTFEEGNDCADDGEDTAEDSADRKFFIEEQENAVFHV